MTERVDNRSDSEARAIAAAIWTRWFTHMSFARSVSRPLLSAADQIAFYEIAQPLIADSLARAKSEPQALDLVKQAERIAELRLRAERAEAEVERLRAYQASLPDAARKILEDAARPLCTARTPGLADYERIDRLEKLWAQVDQARQWGRGCPACAMVGDDANGSNHHAGSCAVAEIAREVAQR